MDTPPSISQFMYNYGYERREIAYIEYYSMWVSGIRAKEMAQLARILAHKH